MTTFHANAPVRRSSSNDDFTPPAPSGPHGGTLADLNGGDPNGTWSLFVVDDFFTDGGNITGGWSVTIETSLGLVDLEIDGYYEPSTPDNFSGHPDNWYPGEGGSWETVEVRIAGTDKVIEGEIEGLPTDAELYERTGGDDAEPEPEPVSDPPDDFYDYAAECIGFDDCWT